MADLILENVEAFKFCDAASSDPSPYLLYPGETFGRFISGVFATSRPDLHGHLLSIEDLRRFVQRQNKSPMYVNRLHDTSVPPIGRIIASEIFRHQTSDEYFIAGVIGLYSKASYGSWDASIDSFLLACSEEPSIEMASVEVLFDEFELSPGASVNFESAPALVSKDSRQILNKGIDTAQIVILALTAAGGAVGAGFFGELGKDLYTWLKGELLSKLRDSGQRRVLGISWRLGRTRVEAYIDLRECQDVPEALELLSRQSIAIENAIKNPEQGEVARAVFNFAAATRKWELGFCVLVRGQVKTARPVTDLDIAGMKGISIGATIARDTREAKKPNGPKT